eukprot:UC4_evm3s575
MTCLHPVERVEIDIDGALTDPSKAFAAELEDDERIISSIEVDLCGPPRRSTTAKVLLTVCTLGLYTLWQYCFKCIRGTIIETQRCRLAVTDRRRILVWVSQAHGHQAPYTCVKSCGDDAAPVFGERVVYSQRTRVYHFSTLDLAMMQYLHRSERPSGPAMCFPFCLLDVWSCFGCFKREAGYCSTLRLYFGRYPTLSTINTENQGHYGEYSAAPNMIDVSGVIGTRLIEKWFKYKYFGCWAKNFFSVLGCLAYPFVMLSNFIDGKDANGFEKHNMVEITSYNYVQENKEIESCGYPQGRKDRCNNKQETFDRLSDIQKVIAGAKDDILVAPSESQNFCVDENDDSPLIYDGKVYIGKQGIPIAREDGERVIDAIPQTKNWTLAEHILFLLLCFTVIGAIIYWYFWLRPRYRKDEALILTNRRIISVLSDGFVKPVCNKDREIHQANPALEFEMQSCSYFFSEMHTGVIIRKKKSVHGRFNTSLGALIVCPRVRTGGCDITCHGLEEEKFDIANKFLQRILDRPMKKCVLKNVAGMNMPWGTGIELESTYNLHKLGSLLNDSKYDESITTIFESDSFEAQRILPYDFCSKPTCIVYCGCKPVRNKTSAIVTSHRSIFLARPENDPKCPGFRDCNAVTNKESMIVSVPHESKDIQGWRIDNKIHFENDCWTAYCFMCGYTKAKSNMTIEIGISDQYPIVLYKAPLSQSAASSSPEKQGHLNDVDIKALQQALRLSCAGRANEKAAIQMQGLGVKQHTPLRVSLKKINSVESSNKTQNSHGMISNDAQTRRTAISSTDDEFGDDDDEEEEDEEVENYPSTSTPEQNLSFSHTTNRPPPTLNLSSPPVVVLQPERNPPPLNSRRLSALYDFDPADEIELKVDENEILFANENIEAPEGWTSVSNISGQSGLVPSSYLQEEADEIGNESSSTDVLDSGYIRMDSPGDASPGIKLDVNPYLENGGESAPILYDFNPEDSSEIKVTEGDTVTVFRQHVNNSEGWVTVRKTDGSMGLVPESYVGDSEKILTASYDYTAKESDE